MDMFFDIPRTELDEVLDRTPDVWERLRGGRLFLTGGTGFFGRWLLASLLRANERLGTDIRRVVMSRNPDGFIDRSAPERVAIWGAGHPALAIINLADLERPGPVLCPVQTLENEVLAPKVAAVPQADGTLVSMPLEDMTPLPLRDEVREAMLVPLLPVSEEVTPP